MRCVRWLRLGVVSALLIALAIGVFIWSYIPARLYLGLPLRSGSFEIRGTRIAINVDEAAVPAFELPALLRFEDETQVVDAEGWARRRLELLELFSAHVYGRTPLMRAPISTRRIERDVPALGGAALRSQVRVFLLGREDGPWMDVLLYRPAGPGPAPVFLGLNFRGNAAIHADPEILLSESWMRGGFFAGDRATPDSRGVASARWPIEEIVARGYAIATVYSGDLAPDAGDHVREGILGAFPERDTPDAWGAIGAWAFGLSRALDWLESVGGVDASRVAVFGHSRLGKTALWAGAQDERFAMVISNDSGCTGAALSRRRFGETILAMTTFFPHWMAPRLASYAGREDELPVDQHQLLALIAPRPLYVASAEDDTWADPRGEFLATREAAAAYQLLGTGSLALDSFSAPADAVDGAIGYHVRSGGHDITLEDWRHTLDFADLHLAMPDAVRR